MSHFSYAQIHPDSLPQRDDIVGDILTRVYRTKSPAFIELANEFQSYWDGGSLNSKQKEYIEKTYSSIEKRGLPTYPYLFFVLKTVSNSGGNELIQISAMTEILEVMQQVYEKEKTQNITAFSRNINSFLTNKAIHYSNGYKLLVDNIDFSFEYIDRAVPHVFEDQPDEYISDVSENESNSDDAGTSGDDWGDDWSDSGDSWASDDDWASDDSWNSGTDSWNNSADSWGSTNEGWGTTSDNQGGWSDGQDNFNQPVDALPEEDEQLMIDAIVDVPLPVEEGPVIRFDNTDLVFVTHYDTIKLSGSKGAYQMVEDMYIGEGGTFFWNSFGLSSETVYCNLGKYAFSVLRPQLLSVKSELTHKDKLAQPIQGTFEYRSENRHPETKPTYPRFTSYKRDIRVYFPADDQLIFKGGFSMTGDKMTSKSLLSKKSVIEVKNETGIFYRAKASEFILSDSLITSQYAEIKLYVGRDSIAHPGVKFNYEPSSRELIIIKAEGKYHISPYTISYYDVDISADMIRWDLDADSLDISISSAQNIVPAYFESVDYFNKKDMKSLSGIYNFNPLIMAVHYSRKNNKRSFNVYDLARAYKQNEITVKATMISLMKNGFIEFNELTGQIVMKEKAYHYVDANRFEKDYDDLKIKSLSPLKPNATLNIPEQEIVIRGITRFYVSEILDVFILPEQNEITLLKDRDLKFNGQLFAGNFEFIGREFLFDYDSFFVDMTTIDSIRFYIDNSETGRKEMVDNKLVTAGDSSAQQTMDGLTQEFQESTGRLFINRPDNKSGQKIYPYYPRFNADKGAIVYFDSKEVLDGAYDKSMYFVIPPFEIDSLSGSDPSAIGFNGTFVAEGILPSFEETLHIMDDNSLGFNHTIAPEGYQLYDGSARIYEKLKMDKNGLTAQGSIKYISSTFESDDLTIYMDSLTGKGYNFVMMEGDYDGGSFPDAYVDQFNLKWLPRKDSMYIVNIEKPFSLYKNTATLDGTLTVSQPGGFGKGKLLTRGAEARSVNFSFNQHRFGARHAFFEIKSDNPEKPALSGEDILLNFNLEENYADIGPEIEGVAAINFPYAQFKTSISNARWNLNDRTVTMTKPENVDIENSYFYATREELDSLAFNASKAVYDIDELELLISGIPYIKVADAKITPENNEVLVLENAKIGTLYNTTIVIDTVNEYHRLYDGTIDILSRNKFEGRATYQFVNAVNDTFAIKIDEFLLVENEEGRSRDLNLHTQAMGYVFEKDSVVISPGMLYKGEAIMYAPDPAFQLNGFVNLLYRPNLEEDIWIRYRSNETETQEVKFDFENARTENDLPLVAGIHYDDNDRLYSTFINDKKSVMDKDFFIPSGILSFNADSSWYMIEDTLKTTGETYSGKIFGLHAKSRDLVFEGPIDFHLISEDFELIGSAIGTGNIEKNEYQMEAFLTMDYDLPSQAIYEMSTDMLEEVDMFALPVAYRDDPNLLYKLSEIIGERATIDYEQKSLEEYTPLVSMTSQLMKTLVIPEVQLNWSDKHKAWYSTGKIGVANVMRDDINALVDGFLEIKKNETGDVINLFLQFSPTCWYFFNFEENRMITSSSNEDYLDIIADKTNALKADFGEYFVLDGEFSEAMRFIERFRKEYLGITEPYELEYAPVDQSIPLFEETEEKEEQPTDDGFIIPEEVVEEEADDDGF